MKKFQICLILYSLLFIAHKTEIVNSSNLSADDLQARNGKIIIERVVGVVDDAETGAGHTIDNGNYYICYDDVEGISKGNKVCTYLVYNPGTNYVDDVVARFDYIIQ